MTRPKFEYTDHTADMGIKAYGDTLEDLFAHAAEALFGVIVDGETIQPHQQRMITIEGDALEDLLVQWLNELLFLFDTEGLIFQHFDVTFKNAASLKATASGETVDPSRHDIKTTIKAVTYHDAKIRKDHDGWVCQVLLDL